MHTLQQQKSKSENAKCYRQLIHMYLHCTCHVTSTNCSELYFNVVLNIKPDNILEMINVFICFPRLCGSHFIDIVKRFFTVTV